MWINKSEMQLLEKVMNDEINIPLNKKGDYKLRHISFFMTSGKSIKNVCNNLEKIACHNTDLHHQYKEVIRKYGLTTTEDKLTKYGKMLLSIIHFDDNRIYKEMKNASSVNDLSEDIPFVIEFFLFCVVYKLVNDKQTRDSEHVELDDLANSVIDSADYFFCNVKDTLLETSNRNTDVSELFGFENKDFYKTIQGINYSGYEIKKLLRLPIDTIKSFVELYTRLLNGIASINKATLTNEELPYYKQIRYYSKQVQQDVVNRLRHSILNYIIIKSIVKKRNKISLDISEEFSKIYDSDFVQEVFEKYNLKEIYNLVFFEKDSKYINKEYKALYINKMPKKLEFIFTEEMYKDRNIGLNDKVILYNDETKQIETDYTYNVSDITQQNDKYIYLLEKYNVINKNKIKLLESQIGGLVNEIN